MQDAVAKALVRARQPYEGHSSYYAWLLAEYTRKRDLLQDGLRAAGIAPVAPEGSFFVMGDTSRIAVPERFYQSQNGGSSSGGERAPRDWAFCRFLTTEIGVAAIPVRCFVRIFLCLFELDFSISMDLSDACNSAHQPSAFMSDANKHGMGNYARFAFCKKDETLQEACQRLFKLKQYQQQA